MVEYDATVRELRKQAYLWFAVAFMAGICGFVALFKGGLDFFVASGGALLCFVGFWYACRRAFERWDAYVAMRDRRGA